jgi:hypothetical protein
MVLSRLLGRGISYLTLNHGTYFKKVGGKFTLLSSSERMWSS